MVDYRNKSYPEGIPGYPGNDDKKAKGKGTKNPLALALLLACLAMVCFLVGNMLSASDKTKMLNGNIAELNQALDATYTDLENTRTELKSAKEKVEVLETRNQEVEAELAATVEELDGAKLSLVAAQETNETLQKTVDDMNAQAEELMATMEAVKEKINEQANAAVEKGDVANTAFWNAKKEEAVASTRKFNTMMEDFAAFAGVDKAESKAEEAKEYVAAIVEAAEEEAEEVEAAAKAAVEEAEEVVEPAEEEAEETETAAEEEETNSAAVLPALKVGASVVRAGE